MNKLERAIELQTDINSLIEDALEISETLDYYSIGSKLSNLGKLNSDEIDEITEILGDYIIELNELTAKIIELRKILELIIELKRELEDLLNSMNSEELEEIN